MPQRVLIAAAIVATGLALLIALPVARLAGVALDGGRAALFETLRDPLAVTAMWNSLWTGALVVLLAVSAGTLAALVTERLAGRSRGWLRILMLMPLLVPPFVTAQGWARAYGPRGLLDQALGLSLPGMFGAPGVILVVTVSAIPLAWLVVAGALATRVEPDAERAARASGADALTTMRTVTLPLLRPALLAASAVVFVFAVNAFGVVAVLGTPAGFATITTRIYGDLVRSADPAAFTRVTTLALLLVVLALAVTGSADALFGRGRTRRTGLPAGAAASARRGRLAVGLLAGALVAAAVVPFLALVLTALTRAVGLPPLPSQWTLANFADVIDVRFAGALATSLVLAIAAATIVLGLGAVGTVLTGRARWLGSGVSVGFAVPGSALAIAVLLAYGAPLRDTLALILVAYVAKLWMLGQRQLVGSVDGLPADAIRAARASGASVVDTLRTIIVPLLWPAIAAAWLIVFLFALHELTMSSLLYGPGTATLAVLVLNVQQLGDPTLSAALAVLLTLVALIAVVPLALLGRRRREVASWRAGR